MSDLSGFSRISMSASATGSDSIFATGAVASSTTSAAFIREISLSESEMKNYCKTAESAIGGTTNLNCFRKKSMAAGR